MIVDETRGVSEWIEVEPNIMGEKIKYMPTYLPQREEVTFYLYFSEPFTPYKIWVQAFYNFSSLSNGYFNSWDVKTRLGPSAESLYVLTDVTPPSAPQVLNLTCDQAKRK